MKILITTDWYTPAVNGVVTSVKNLQRELERRGHEVRILTLSQSLHSWSRDGVTAIGSVNAGRIYPGARLRTAMAGRWVRELMDWRPDVIHSQCEFSTFFLARRIAEELDVPLVHTYHTVYEDYTHYFSPSVRWGRCAVAAFSRWVAAQVDGMIAPTGKVRGLLQGYGVRCPVFVVPTGIDLRRFQQEGDPMRRAVLRASLGIPAENTVLVCVGRLAEEKNIQELLKLRASLGSRPVTLLLVGDGPDRPRLEQVAHDLRLEAPAVIFAGMVPPEEVPEWYRLGDLFVSASSSETQGLTYIEALAAGVPALRVYFALFIPMSLQMAGQGVFVSLGRSKQAVFFSLLRKAIINAPLTVVLPIWMGTTGVFTAEAISQLVGGLACSLTMYFTVYRPLGRLPDRPPENI